MLLHCRGSARNIGQGSNRICDSGKPLTATLYERAFLPFVSAADHCVCHPVQAIHRNTSTYEPAGHTSLPSHFYLPSRSSSRSTSPWGVPFSFARSPSSALGALRMSMGTTDINLVKGITRCDAATFFKWQVSQCS